MALDLPSTLELTYQTILAFSLTFWLIGCLSLLVVARVSALPTALSETPPALPPLWRQQQCYEAPWPHAAGVGLKSRHQETRDVYGAQVPPKKLIMKQESKEEESSDSSEEGSQGPAGQEATVRGRAAQKSAVRAAAAPKMTRRETAGPKPIIRVSDGPEPPRRKRGRRDR
ncbi:MAG: hypothetical protein Q9210_003034 [Variospora velana]